jgi:hypothetical protein
MGRVNIEPSPISGGNRICHWSYRAAAVLALVLFGFVLLPVFTLRGNDRLIWVIVYALAECLFARATICGAIRKKQALKIRGLWRTVNISWDGISDVEIVAQGRGSILRVTTTSGRNIEVWGSSGTDWIPSTAQWLAESQTTLRKWISEGRDG